jgi:asparagine synthase (glutamine-hydrolysing)
VSGIFGVLSLHGAPACTQWLEPMRTAMHYYGPDGSGALFEGPAAFGHLLLAILPEDRSGQQPQSLERGILTAAARLDNRAELLEVFTLNGAQAARTSDDALVGLAWERWGDEVCSHLQGDWALAAWDTRKRRLLLARDACGNATFYLHQSKDHVAFASSLKALLALPGARPEPDPMRLAQVLLAWQQDADRTAYKNYERLAWTQAISIDQDGNRKTWQHWQPERHQLIRYRSPEDYVEHFLNLYRQAVSNCLRTQQPVAATLSAGRDSASVVALAAPLLAEQDRELAAYTSVPLFAPDGQGEKLGDEWELAHQSAVLAGPNVRHHAINAAEQSVLSSIEHLLQVHDGPMHAAGNAYWLRAISEQTVAGKAAVLLTGSMGNANVSWRGNGSALSALCRSQFGVAARLLLHAEPDLLLLIKRQLLKPLLWPILHRWNQHGSSTQPPWRNYSALNPAMAEQLKIDERMKNAGWTASFTFPPHTDLRRHNFLPVFSIGAGIWSESAAWHQIAALDPTMNLALVEFLLRVPEDQFYRHGVSSLLFRRAFAHRLPPAVLEGKRKGLQAADVGHRILQEREAIQSCLTRLEANAAACAFLSLPLLRSTLQELETGVNPQTTQQATSILLRGIAVGLFLERF